MAAQTRPQTARSHLYVPPNHVRQAQHLPWPATTLVIAQHFFRSHCGRYWAWLVTGTFYDVRDKALWSSEVFLVMNPEDSDEEGEGDEGGEGWQYVYDRESSSGSESGSGTDGPDTGSGRGLLWLRDGEGHRGRTGRAGYHGISQDISTRHRNWEDLTSARSLFFHGQPPRQIPRLLPHLRPPPGTYAPPQNWDPTRQGAVPGHWTAAFDPSAGWISYFEPASANH